MSAFGDGYVREVGSSRDLPFLVSYVSIHG